MLNNVVYTVTTVLLAVGRCYMGRLKELVNVKECGKCNDHCCKGLVGLLMLTLKTLN